jgi:hypothetical protein
VISSVCICIIIVVVVLGKSRDRERHYEVLDTGNSAERRRVIGQHTAQEGDDTGYFHVERINEEIYLKE